MYPGMRIAATLITVGILCTAQSAVANEEGSFSMIASWARDYTTLERPGRAITTGTLDGTTTILESSGGPFVAGAHSRSTCLVYARKSENEHSLEAHCTVADAANDEFYMRAQRREGDTQAGGGGAGRWEFLGGTGKYAGVTGGCDYQVEYLVGDWAVNMAKHCEWHRP